MRFLTLATVVGLSLACIRFAASQSVSSAQEKVPTISARAVLAGLAVLLAAAARPAWGQSSWPSYPNNSTITVTSGGNVGIATTNPL